MMMVSVVVMMETSFQVPQMMWTRRGMEPWGLFIQSLHFIAGERQRGFSKVTYATQGTVGMVPQCRLVSAPSPAADFFSVLLTPLFSPATTLQILSLHPETGP